MENRSRLCSGTWEGGILLCFVTRHGDNLFLGVAVLNFFQGYTPFKMKKVLTLTNAVKAFEVR